MQILSKISNPGNLKISNFKISGIQLHSYYCTELCRFRIFANNAINFSLEMHHITRSAPETSVSIRIYLLAYIWSNINYGI